MAFDNKDSSNLAKIARSYKKNISVSVPSGKGQNEEVEVQYSEMDLIAGLCSAALFGQSNINNKNYKELLNKPSYLKNILDNLNTVISSGNSGSSSSINSYITNTTSIPVKLMKIDNGFQFPNSFAQVLIDINGIQNVDSLADTLERMGTNLNQPVLFDGLSGLIETLEEMNNVGTVDLSKVQDNLNKATNLITALNNLQLQIVKPDNFNSKIDEIIQNIGIYKTKIKELYDQLNNFLDINKGDIQQLTKLSKQKIELPDLDIFKPLLEKIDELLKDHQNIKNINGLGEFINSLLNIISFNPPNKAQQNIQFVTRIFKQDMGELLKSVNNLNGIITNQVSLESLRNIQWYFDTLLQLSDIGLIKKIRMLTNIFFFENVVNKLLPGLINDVNAQFSGLTLDKNVALDNLSNYFKALKSIASLSLKDQLNIVTSIYTFKEVIINELVNLIKEINEKFKDVTILDKDFNGFINFLNNISYLKINDDIDSEREKLYEVQKLIFGSSFLGSKIENFLGESSIYGIIKLLELNKDVFTSYESYFDNLNNILTKLSSLSNPRINEDNIVVLKNVIYMFFKDIVSNLIEFQKLKIETENLQDSIDKVRLIAIDINSKFRNTNLNKAFEKILINPETYKKFKNTIKAFDEFSSLMKKINKLNNISEKIVWGGFEKIVDNLHAIIKKFNDIDSKSIESAIKLMKNISAFMVICSGVLILGSLLMGLTPIENVFTFLGGISVMIFLFRGLFKLLGTKEFDPNNLKEKINLMYQISYLIAGLGVTMALCSYLMKNIKLPDVLIFLGGLVSMLAIVGGILFILNKFGDKMIKESLPIVKDLGLLILFCGLALSLAAFVSKNIDPVSLFVFGVSLSILIASILVPMIFFKTVKILLFDGIADLGKLVLYCTFSLILAGFVAKYIDKGELAKFTTLLMFLVSGIILATGAFGKKEIQGAADLGKLVLYSAAALLIGGLLFMIGGQKLKDAVWDFGLYLLGFTSVLLLAAGFAGAIGKKGFEHIGNIKKIVIAASAALLIGGLLFMIGGREFRNAVWEFAAVLFLFIAGISLVIGIAAAIASKKNMGKMWMIALIVGVTAFAMTLGPTILKENNVGFLDLLSFVVCSLILVGGMAAIIYLVGQIPKGKLLAGIIGVLAIEFLIYGIGVCMDRLVSSIKLINDNGGFNFILDGLKSIGLVFGAVAAVVAVLAGLASAGGGIGALVMGAGVAFLASLEGLIYGMAKCIKEIVTAVIAVQLIKNVDIKESFSPLKDFIEEASSLFGKVSLRKSANIKLATNSLSGLGKLISSIAKSVQSYASLTIPDFDDNGKATGKFRKMGPTDFQDAAKNISTIISVLGLTILAMYTGKVPEFGSDGKFTGKYYQIIKEEDAKEMFAGGGILSGGTRFSKVVKSVSKLGNLVSSIARGIKDYAELKFDNTKYDGDIFKHASDNISKVIRLLSLSILGLYYGKKYDPDNNTFQDIATNGVTINYQELFDSSWYGGDSPFKKILNSTSKLGNLISSIATGIKSYAALNFPDQWDSTGKPIHFKEMGDDEFAKAGDNIGKVILAIGTALAEVANKDVFKDIYNTARLKNITDSISTVTNLLDPLGKVIYKYSQGIFPRIEYKDGKITTNYGEGAFNINDVKGGWEGVQNKLTESISNVLLGLGKALLNIYTNKENTKLINILKDSKEIKEISSSITEFSKSLSTIFDNISIILAKKIWSSKITSNIVNPFITYANLFPILESTVPDPEELRKKINVVSESITSIFEKLSKIENNNSLESQQKAIGEYINSVNTVDISKADSLTGLTNSISNLGNKFGNLDKFTEVLANKLSQTLIKLSKEINSASQVIKKSDELQKKREKNIKNSISEITKLMDKSMVVTIQNEQENSSGDGAQYTPTDTGEGGTPNLGGGMTDNGGNNNDNVLSQQQSSGGRNSGGTQRMVVDLDYNQLAEVLAATLKKILS